MDSMRLFRCRAELPGVCLGEAGCGPVCKACTPLISVDDGECHKNQYNAEAATVAEEHRSSCQFLCKTVKCWEWVRIRCKSGFCHKCSHTRDGGVTQSDAPETAASSEVWALALPTQPSHPPPPEALARRSHLWALASPPTATDPEARDAQSSQHTRRVAMDTSGMDLIFRIDAISETLSEMRQDLDDLRSQTWSFMGRRGVSAASRQRSRSRTPILPPRTN